MAEIWDHYATVAGADVADNVVRRIENAAQMLVNHPLAGRSRDEIRLGLRSITSAPYVLFYRVRANIAEIVRVLHGRRDIERIFLQQPNC